MPNPVVATYTAGQWHRVLTNFTEARRIINHTFDTPVQMTYRVTGDPAPTDLEDGLVFNISTPVIGLTSDPIDVYVYPLTDAASIEVSLLNEPLGAGGGGVSIIDLIDHEFADRAARDAFYTTNASAATNRAELTQGETVILVLDNGSGDAVIEIWVAASAPASSAAYTSASGWADITSAIPSASVIKTLYESNANTNALTDVKLAVLNVLSIVNNELVSSLPIRASEFRADTGSLGLGDAEVSFAGGGLELQDPITSRQCGLIQKQVGTERPEEYIDQAEKTVDIQVQNTMAGPGDFTVTYTAPSDVGRDGVRVVSFVVIPEAAGEGTVTVRQTDANGPEYLSEYSQAFVAGDVGNETTFELDNSNAFRVEDGTILHITYTGPALRGSLVSSAYFPFLRVVDQDYTVVSLARMTDVTGPTQVEPITSAVSYTATGTQNVATEITGKVHVLSSGITGFDTLSGQATFSDNGLFSIVKQGTGTVEFDVSATGQTFAGLGSGVAYDIPGGTAVLFYVSGSTIYPITSDAASGGTGTMGDHPVVLTRNTPNTTDLNTLAQESLNDNSGLWIVASDQDSTFESTIESTIMIRSLRSGVLDANGAAISTTAVQKSGVRLAGGTVVRVFGQNDLRVVSGPLMAAGSRYPDVQVITGPVSLVGNQVLYNIYRNHTAVANLNTGQTLEFRLPSLQNATDLAYLNRNDVFCFRNDGTNGTFRIRTFQVGTSYSDGSSQIDVLPGRTLCITPAPSGAVWTILQFGQSTEISTESITLNTDWYRDGADATAADNSVRLHHRQEVVNGIVRDHIANASFTNNPVSLRFQSRNVQDDIAWINWWTAFDSSVPPLGTMVEEIKANVPGALSYIETNINNGFDFDFVAPDSVLSISSIGFVSGNTVRLTLHSAYTPPSVAINHPIRVQNATNAVHNGTFLVDSAPSAGVLHITNAGVSDSSQDEAATSAYLDVPVFADAVFVSHDVRQVNFNLFKDAARTSQWTSIPSGWFDPDNTDAASVLAIGYNTDIETTGSQLAVQDDAGDFFSVKGGPRFDTHLFDNRTTYTSSGSLLPINYPSIQIDTLGVNTFYLPEFPDQLNSGEARRYTVESLSGNDGNDVSLAIGHPGAGNFVTFDEGFEALDILPGTRHIVELYNDGSNSGVRVISPISKTVPAFPTYQTPTAANSAQISPLPVSGVHVIAAQNEDINRRFIDPGFAVTNKLTLRADADYVFDASVEVLFAGTEGTGLLFLPCTLMPVITRGSSDDKEEFAHTVSLLFSRNGQSGSSAPKFSHTLRVRFEWQGQVGDTVEFQLRFGSFPAGYNNSHIEVKDWRWSATAQLNLN